MRMVVSGGAIPVLIGLVVGLGGALGLTRFIQSMLFATSTLDVTTLLAAAGLLLAVALAACLVPARRAARADPMSALRQE